MAVTGKIEIVPPEGGEECCIRISAVGGILEKVEAAEEYGLKAVIIPMDNYRTHPIVKRMSDYKIQILAGMTDEDYLNLITDYSQALAQAKLVKPIKRGDGLI